jgi:hypothetical protein
MMTERYAAGPQAARPKPYRNQFFFGQDIVPPEGWNSLSLGNLGLLAAHPDLSLTEAQNATHRLLVIGEMFDWADPSASNRDIVARLAERHLSLESLLDASDELGGRWVLIRIAGNEATLVHDAVGLRAVCFSRDPDGRLVVASDQGMLARIAGLPPNQSALAFVEAFSRKVSQWWLPGDGLLFQGGRQLLPNHALNLATGSTWRFWPGGSPSGDSEDAVIERCAARLSGILLSASKRFPMALGLSAGLDSRILLAFCRPFRQELRAYSTFSGNMEDVELPTRLCKSLGIRHDRLDPAPTGSPVFKAAFNESVFRPLNEFEPYLEAELGCFQRRMAGVTGNIAEVLKMPYDPRLKEAGFDNKDPSHLAKFAQMHGFEYAETAIADWRQSVPDNSLATIAEMFYWENRCGRWLSRNALMFDISWQEIIMPFNCRALLSDFLQIPAALREGPNYQVFQTMIRDRWPETLSEPVISKMPGKRSRWSRIRRSLRKILRRTASRPG